MIERETRGLPRREMLRLGIGGGLSLGAAGLLPGIARAVTPAGDLAAAAMPRVAEVVAKWVGTGKLPGIVADLGFVGHDTLYLARGTEGFTSPAPMTADSLFRIYSMTKPITGMAAMILVDEGKLKLDQPLADILPAYAHMTVQNTYDGSLTDVRPAKNPITIRNLLTHTSGLGYAIIQQGPLHQAMVEQGIVAGAVSRKSIPGLDRGKAAPTLAAFADRLATLPLVYEPNTKWSYSLGLDLMGRVIEVVSGQPFDAFLQARLFAPLGMTSTFFQVPASEAGRLTTNHAVADKLLIPIDVGSDSVFLDKPPFPFGGSGLVSSPRDYDKFQQMLTGYGLFQGRRVMSEAAVRLGTSNLLPPGVGGPDFFPGSLFGAGGRVGTGRDEGIFGWAGAAGTLAEVNLNYGLRFGFYAQFMPPTALPILQDYATALRADITALAARRAAA
jgi:CubicO group peptidase (beta-lactamase class C family)